MGHPRPLFVYFHFLKQILQLLKQNVCEKLSSAGIEPTCILVLSFYLIFNRATIQMVTLRSSEPFYKLSLGPHNRKRLVQKCSS